MRGQRRKKSNRKRLTSMVASAFRWPLRSPRASLGACAQATTLCTQVFCKARPRSRAQQNQRGLLQRGLLHMPERNARPRSAESTQQNQRGLLQRGLLHARPQTQCQKSLALSRINGGSPERNARPRSAESTGHRPAHIPSLSLGLHRPGPHWHLQAHIPSPTAPVPFQHRGGPEDREIKSFLADIDQSTQIGNKP